MDEVLDDTSDVVEDSPEPEAAVEEQPWNVSREEWEATQNYLQQTAPLLQQIQQQQMLAAQQQQQAQMQQQMPQLPQEFDPFDPESVRNYIDSHVQYGVQSGIQQAISPYEGMMASVAQQQGEAQAREAMEMIQSEVGEFDQDMAFMFASGVIDQVADPTQALRFGAQQAKAYEDKIRADAVEKYKKEMSELSQAPREAPVGGTSADVMEKVPTGPDRYEEIAARWLARQHPTSPVG